MEARLRGYTDRVGNMKTLPTLRRHRRLTVL